MEDDVMTTLSVKGSPGEYSKEQWARACLVHLGTRDSMAKNDHSIPVRRPDGTLDPDLMKAAAAALFTSSFDQQKKRQAARELMLLYREVDDNPPDSFKGLAGRVERHDLSDRTLDRAIEDARLAAIELNAESASDGDGILDTERIATYGRENGLSFPDARQQLHAALSGDLRRQRETERRIQNLADEHGLDFSDAAEQDAIERASEQARETPRSWLDRLPEERVRLIKEEAERQGYV